MLTIVVNVLTTVQEHIGYGVSMGKIKLECDDLSIVGKMARTMRHLDKMISKSIVEFSLTKPQLDLLFVLKYSTGEINATDIAEKLFVSKANVSGLIARLEKDGHIIRGVDPEDSRAKKLLLTDKAHSVLNKIIPKYSDMISKIMSKFSEEEKVNLLGQLEYIESCMSQGGVSDVE